MDDDIKELFAGVGELKDCGVRFISFYVLFVCGCVRRPARPVVAIIHTYLLYNLAMFVVMHISPK